MRTEMPPEKIKEFLDGLERRRVHYMVIAGLGLDGKRGYLSRPHQDLDVLCAKDDLSLVEDALRELGYAGERHNDLYKAFDGHGGKVDIGLVSFEEDEAVTYGRIAITRFPRSLFEHPQKGRIDGLAFSVAPNELLKAWGSSSKNGDDAAYARTLPADAEQTMKIKRILREKQ